MKKYIFLSLVSLVLLIIFFQKDHMTERESLNKGLSKNREMKKILKESKLVKVKDLESKRRKLSSKGFKKKIFSQKIEWIDRENIDSNPVWEKMDLVHQAGLIASSEEISDRKLIVEYKGFYIYQSTPVDVENIFFDRVSEKVKIWTQEVVIKISQEYFQMVSELEGIEITRRLRNHLIIKFSNPNNAALKIKQLYEIDEVEEIKLDTLLQRRKQI
tara:strand:+ start:135 stop:782 length:648 start_codon:yes stop_codon:yes gene_type:complete